jgi:hypothetical protein
MGSMTELLPSDKRGKQPAVLLLFMRGEGAGGGSTEGDARDHMQVLRHTVSGRDADRHVLLKAVRECGK